MLRAASSLSVLTAVVSAFLLYAVNYETRRLAKDVERLEQRQKELIAETAVARADLAYLKRPERIGPLARAIGLEPVKGHQIVTRESLSGRLTGGEGREGGAQGAASR